MDVRVIHQRSVLRWPCLLLLMVQGLYGSLLLSGHTFDATLAKLDAKTSTPEALHQSGQSSDALSRSDRGSEELIEQASNPESPKVPELLQRPDASERREPLAQKEARGDQSPLKVYIIPIRGQIAKPQAFILRRGLREAQENGVQTIVLDINTPGGAVDVTVDMMQLLNRFKGKTIAYVNTEALSAGALISAAAKDIVMHPEGVIGAAAVIQGTGQDVPETARLKVESYLNARIRAISSERPHRASVIRAMIDEDYVFEIDGEVIKPAGELLSLTAVEATRLIGTPPSPLLAKSQAESVDALLNSLYGQGNYEIKAFEITAAESIAKYLSYVTPILISIAFFLLFIEFKTPGFGVFGSIGVILFGIVFFSQYIAGLSGHEEVLVFLLGVILLGVELFVVPGTLIAGILGIALMLGSLVWALADVWPQSDGSIEWEALTNPLMEVFGAFIGTIVLFIVLLRFLPRSWVWDRIVLSAQIKDTASPMMPSKDVVKGTLVPVGALAQAASQLNPSGDIVYEGKRYQALCESGLLQNGTRVRITGQRDFVLLVAPIETPSTPPDA